MTRTVEAVNRKTAIVLFDDNTMAPITNWMDADGETEDRFGATHCVAGPDRDGKWYVVDLRDFVWHMTSVH